MRRPSRADAQLGLEAVFLGEPRLGEERVQPGARLLEDVVGAGGAEGAREVVRRGPPARSTDRSGRARRPSAGARRSRCSRSRSSRRGSRPGLRRQPVAGLDVEPDVVVEPRRPRQRRERRQRDRQRRDDHDDGRRAAASARRPAAGDAARCSALDRPGEPGAAEDAEAERRRRRVPVVERHPQQRVGAGEHAPSTPAAAGTTAPARWRARRRRSTATASAASPARNPGSAGVLSHRNRRSQSTRPRPNAPHRPLSRCASLAWQRRRQRRAVGVPGQAQERQQHQAREQRLRATAAAGWRTAIVASTTAMTWTPSGRVTAASAARIAASAGRPRRSARKAPAASASRNGISPPKVTNSSGLAT